MEEENKTTAMKKSDLIEFEEKFKEVMAHSNATRNALERVKDNLRDNKSEGAPPKPQGEVSDKPEQPKNRIIDCKDKLIGIDRDLTAMNELITEIRSMVG